MGKQDARSLSAEGQEDLRRRVVEAVQKGLSQTEAARLFGLARGTVSRWMGLVERVGRRALKARRRGRPPVSRLKPHQAATTVRHILSGCPDQLSMPFALWTRTTAENRSEEHTSELQSPCNLVCRLLLEKKKKKQRRIMKSN